MPIRRKRSLLALACLLMTNAGCWQQSAPPAPTTPSFKGITLKVGALDEPALLDGVSAQRGEWTASRGGAIDVLEKPLSLESARNADVLVFPGDRLGDLIDAGLLGSIPNEAVMPVRRTEESGDDPARPAGAEAVAEEDSFDYMDIEPAYRDTVTRYGNQRMALPYGASGLVLVYHRDALRLESNRASAAEKGLKLEPPKTWDQLDALARFFQGRDWSGDGKPDSGIALAMADDAEGLATATFLARAASLGQHPDQFSFEFDTDKLGPRITTEPFVEALQSLLALKDAGPPGVETFDASRAREAFRSGKVALLIDRAEAYASWSGGKPVSVAPLPGSEKVFDPASKTWTRPSQRNVPTYLPHGGGWLMGIRASLEGQGRDAAIDLIRYLANPENSSRIRAERAFPMLPFRGKQLGQGLPDPTAAPDVDSRSWAESIGRMFAERPVVGLRIPGARDYLADLGKGRTAVMAGKPVESALADVARAWEERTRARGPRRQVWHYRRSLNLHTSMTKPPEPGT